MDYPKFITLPQSAVDEHVTSDTKEQAKSAVDELLFDGPVYIYELKAVFTKKIIPEQIYEDT